MAKGTGDSIVDGLNEHKKNRKTKSLVASFSLKLGLIIVILFVILCIFSISSVSKGTENSYKENMEGMIPSFAESVSLWTQKSVQEMHMYTNADIVKTGTQDEIVQWLWRTTNRRSPDFSDVLFCGPDGIAHGQESRGKNIDISDRDYFKAVMKDGKDIYIGDPVVSRLNGDIICQISVAAYDDNKKKIGFFSGIITTDMLQRLVNKTKIGKKGYLFVVDGSGTIIAHPESDIMQKNLNESGSENFRYSKEMISLAGNMKKGYTGEGTIYDRQDGLTTIFYAPIEGTAWSAAAAVPREQINNTAAELAKTIILECSIIVIILLLVSALTIYQSLKPLQHVSSAIKEIATGNADLAKRIKETTNNEIGLVVTGFNQFMEKLQSIIRGVKDSKNTLAGAGDNLKFSLQDTSGAITQILSNIDNVNGQITTQAASVEETSSAVTEIAQNIVSLEKMIENQSSGITEASATIEQMIGNINSVDTSVEKMATAFNELIQNAHTGSEKQENVDTRIRQIENQSEMLQEANTVIASIASQTNLLAMNAAIEAAHAGDAGKGFSVVADEIRKLSETSTEQSKRIGEQLSKIQESISSVVAASAESSTVFTKVSGHISETDELVQQIRQAMDEQSSGSKQINDALKIMNDSTTEVRTASAEMSAGQKAILDEIQHLQEATMSMKESVGQMSIGATKINKTSTSLSDIASNVENSIKRIGEQIDLFKV